MAGRQMLMGGGCSTWQGIYLCCVTFHKQEIKQRSESLIPFIKLFWGPGCVPGIVLDNMGE